MQIVPTIAHKRQECMMLGNEEMGMDEEEYMVCVPFNLFSILLVCYLWQSVLLFFVCFRECSGQNEWCTFFCNI
jgi:hypothetical protein